MDRNLRYFSTAAAIVAMTIGTASPAWAKKRPAPPTTPPARSNKLSPADRQSLKDFKRAYRQAGRAETNSRIAEDRQYLKSLNVKGTRKLYRSAIRAAKKAGDGQEVRALKVDRRGFNAEVQSVGAVLNYDKALKARVYGKGARNYVPPSGGEWKKTANPAPKVLRQALRQNNRAIRARIKARTVEAREAKAAGDTLTAKALGFENTKDRQELNRVGRPALMRASGSRYVVPFYRKRR